MSTTQILRLTVRGSFRPRLDPPPFPSITVCFRSLVSRDKDYYSFVT